MARLKGAAFVGACSLAGRHGVEPKFLVWFRVWLKGCLKFFNIADE